jgi:hypothetical protein
MAIDERRFAELDQKRFAAGLTAEEADELGRMMAEREGKPYSNAHDLEAEERAEEEAAGSLTEEKPSNEDELAAWRNSPANRGPDDPAPST